MFGVTRGAWGATGEAILPIKEARSVDPPGRTAGLSAGGLGSRGGLGSGGAALGLLAAGCAGACGLCASAC